jgi:hypothetical protein
MVLKFTVDRFGARLRRLGMLCLAILIGMIVMLTGTRPAAANTSPCSDPLFRSALVQSKLQIQFHGVDSPTLTSITQITIPENWQGNSGLFRDEQQQGRSLSCFIPINQGNYQSAPPTITVDPPTSYAPADVKITDTITITDGPEVNQPWTGGLWSVTRRTWGYQVVFQPQKITSASGHGPWTVTLNAPDLNIEEPSRQPSIDDGHGTLTWLFSPSQQQPSTQQQQLSKQLHQLSKPQLQLPPPLQQLSAQQQQLSKKLHQLSTQQLQLSWQQLQLKKKLQQLSTQQLQLPKITESVTSPWQVRMNLATYRWPIRWFSDASWTLGDGILVDIVALWAAWRLLRRRGNEPKERRLPISVIFLSLLSIACYAGYVISDYLWHNSEQNTVWTYENLALVAAAAVYFTNALGARRRQIAGTCVLSVAAVFALRVIANLEWPLDFYGNYTRAPNWTAVVKLIGLMTPLLCTVAFMAAGTVLWISRLWPFGAKVWRGRLRERHNTPFRSWRVIPLVSGMFILAALILGQSAAASYYYWQHYDLWGHRPGAFSTVAINLLYDVHWWIGDGLQWSLSFAIVGGIFAVLWAMSADARGVFFGLHTTSDLDKSGERGDLVLLAAIVGSLFVGTWGFYDGVSVPLPFIVTFVGLAVWGGTRKLSKLDWKSEVEGREVNSSSTTNRSLLVTYRDALLAYSERVSGAVGPKKSTTASASEAGTGDRASDDKINALQALIPLGPQPTDNHRRRASRRRQPPVQPRLKLPDAVDPGVTALALGPADTWWDNGVAAVQTGKYLIIFPIVFDIYTFWRAGVLSQLTYLFGLQDTLGLIVSDILRWLIGLFMFGVLLSYLKGIRTPIKGTVFGLIAFAAFAADAAVRHALGVASNPAFIIDGLLAVALFTTVGLRLDICTLRKHNNEGLMSSIYRLGSVRVAVTYATTLIIVGVGIWQAVYLTDQTSQQRAQNISNTAQYVNGAVGTGAPLPGKP